MCSCSSQNEKDILFFLEEVLIKEEDLLCNISVSDSLGCSDDNIVEFGIRLSTLKGSAKTKVLNFRRANLSSLRTEQIRKDSVAGFCAG